MSSIQPSADEMINRLPCEFCGATPGQQCIVPSTGKRYPYPHARRYQAAKTAGIIAEFNRLWKEWQEAES